MDPRDQTLSLPSNLEAEQDLLGGLLYDNGLLDRVPERLRGAHFHEPFHQRLFDLIVQTAVTGRSAEPTLLSDTLKHDPAFFEFGGLNYLLRLVERAPPAKVALDSARSVYDLAVRRDLIRIGQDMAATAADPALTSEEHIQANEAKLFALAENGDQAKGIATFSEAVDGALKMVDAAFMSDGKLIGLSTHLIDLDHKLGGLHPSDLLILAGRPSMGKTALATNIAFRVAKSYAWEPDPEAPHGRRTVTGGRVLFPSLEMSKEQLVLRIAADVNNISNDKVRKGEINAAEHRRIRESMEEIRSIPLHIDDTGGLHIAKLCARARRLHRQSGLDLIIVDYLQLITTDAGKGGNRVQEVSTITAALKALAKELNVPIIALSQLSRQVEQREDKRPQLSDLRESGSIEQDADCVMFVYREAYYLGRAEPREGTDEHLKWCEDMSRLQNQAEVIIGKQRHGPIGTVRLAFDDDTTKFGNLAHNDNYAQPGAFAPREPIYSFQGRD
jgi:replicative DNA helicase